MAKFKDLSLDLETGEHIDFDDDDLIKMGYDGTELYLNSTLSGVRAAQPYHMVRYDQLTEASGTLQDQITLYSDHGNLNGLEDDDHPQYVPRDGSRGFTNTVSGVSAVLPKDLVTYDQLTALSGSLSEADNFVTLVAYTENATTTTTTNTTYQQKIQITVPATISGTIRVMWSVEYNASANNKDVWVRVYNVTDDIVIGENNQQTNNNLNWWTFAGFGYIELAGGTSKVFELQYKAGTAACSVRNAHLEACRITLTTL